MQLSSEFASRLEFKMLRGCPALERLDHHIWITNMDHIRLISESELYVPGTEEDTHDRIVAPKLRKLHMHGRWAFHDQNIMAKFLGG